MKKLGFVYIVCFSLMLLSACGNATFNGSSTGNDTQFIMEYSILNTSDHRKLSLEMGDVIDTTVVSDAGSVDIQVENSVGESIYSEKDVPTSERVFPSTFSTTKRTCGKQGKNNYWWSG